MKRRSLAELQARARAELNRNPTITVYRMVGGREVRRRAEPWASFRAAVRQIGQAFISFLVMFAATAMQALAAAGGQ